MTKPSQHNFSFDKSMAKDHPSVATQAMDFILPALLVLVGATVVYIWFG
ncbi:hypothetical protein [Allomesorhizobium camelthorni]|uniref:Uncharacterized protein n=1 Tax=Allomesorhizobium camelthorni TaxID=475069 RepID=A0A6G4WA29_9HYPH|nr:hypothetical protein [Mesorhizobium camelthorni]NGO51635.1 hypothetical protein [Mesorhizobium camelthorni]